GDVPVCARLQGEDRTLDLGDPVDRPRRAVAAGPGPAVEADRAGQPVAGGGGEPRLPAAHAEADREDRRAPVRAQPLDGGSGVELDLLRRDGIDVRRVVELVVALGGAGGASEVVERERRVAA